MTETIDKIREAHAILEHLIKQTESCTRPVQCYNCPKIDKCLNNLHEWSVYLQLAVENYARVHDFEIRGYDLPPLQTNEATKEETR